MTTFTPPKVKISAPPRGAPCPSLWRHESHTFPGGVMYCRYVLSHVIQYPAANFPTHRRPLVVAPRRQSTSLHESTSRCAYRTARASADAHIHHTVDHIPLLYAPASSSTVHPMVSSNHQTPNIPSCHTPCLHTDADGGTIAPSGGRGYTSRRLTTRRRWRHVGGGGGRRVFGKIRLQSRCYASTARAGLAPEPPLSTRQRLEQGSRAAALHSSAPRIRQRLGFAIGGRSSARLAQQVLANVDFGPVLESAVHPALGTARNGRRAAGVRPPVDTHLGAGGLRVRVRVRG